MLYMRAKEMYQPLDRKSVKTVRLRNSSSTSQHLFHKASWHDLGWEIHHSFSSLFHLQREQQVALDDLNHLRVQLITSMIASSSFISILEDVVKFSSNTEWMPNVRIWDVDVSVFLALLLILSFYHLSTLLRNPQKWFINHAIYI